MDHSLHTNATFQIDNDKNDDTVMKNGGRSTMSSSLSPPLARVRQRTASSCSTRPTLLLSSSLEYCQEILPLSRRLSIDQQQQQQQQEFSWKQRLVQLSNIASILCVIDCTVLPAMTIFLSILGMTETTAASSTTSVDESHEMTTTIMSFFPLTWLQTLGHAMAIYFVLPVGCFTTTMNFMTHKRWSITIPAICGLFMIYIANCYMPHCHHHDGHDSGINSSSTTTNTMTMMAHDDGSHTSHTAHLGDHSTITTINHAMEEEFVDHATMMENHHHHNVMMGGADVTAGYPSAMLMHRLINVMGCLLLLTSNYRAQRLSNGACHDKDCKHGVLRIRN